MSLKPTKSELADPRGISAEEWLRLYQWKPLSTDCRRARCTRLRHLKTRQRISPDYEAFITRTGKYGPNVIVLPKSKALLWRLADSKYANLAA